MRSVADIFCDVNGRQVALDQAPDVPYRGESPGEQAIVWDPDAPLITAKPGDGVTSLLDPEKPHGQWNVCEVVARQGDAVHLLNGEVVLVLFNSRYRDGAVKFLCAAARSRSKPKRRDLLSADRGAPVDGDSARTQRTSQPLS